MLLKKTKEWTKDKHLIAATASVWIVMHSDMFYSYLENLIAGNFNPFLPVKDNKKWLKQYKQHMNFKRIFKNKNASYRPQAMPVLKEVMWPIVNSSLERYRTQPGLFTDTPENFHKHLEFFKQDLHKTILEDFEYDPILATPEKINNLRKSMSPFKEIFETFYFKTQLSCLFIYHTLPGMLLYKARHGDISALDQLLRLDKCTIHDPLIAKIWEYENRYPNKQRFKMISEALVGFPREKITRKKFKITIASIIAISFSVFGEPIPRPEIQKLFDAFASDTKNLLVDPDLPESPEAFSVAIKREIKNWGLRP